MSETTIFLGLGHTAAILWHHDHHRRSQRKCATCGGKREILALDRDFGFCTDCVERSRVLDGDDVGGES
jgi:hypothetical protein